MTKQQFFRVVRQLKPGVTKSQYERMWASFIAAREKHYKLKASLRVITGGKHQ